MFTWLYRQWRRRRLKDRPFPDHWRDILDKHYPFYSKLDDEELETFHTHLKVFLWDKHWEGAAGLEVTEEMKVLVSAAAARIARKLDLSVYDRLTEIVIYPSHYFHPEKKHRVVMGQAHNFGTLVLSWDAVKKGIAIPDDARDTAIHEFAHVLDAESGRFNGTPLLAKGSDYPVWSDVMGEHFARLQDAPFDGCLRPYGAKNEAEFFAVATEAFFETPEQLRRCAPDLYGVLADYFGVDPR